MKRLFTALLLLMLFALSGTACAGQQTNHSVSGVSHTDNAETLNLDELLTADTEPLTTVVPVTTAVTTQPPAEQATTPAAIYILNTNSKKFHDPACPSVTEMKEKNKQAFRGSREEAIAQGYQPCQRCKP